MDDRPLVQTFADLSPPSDKPFDTTGAPALQTIVSGSEWWYWAALILSLAPLSKYTIEATEAGGKIHTPQERIALTSSGERTTIVVHGAETSMEGWSDVFDKLRPISENVRGIRHHARGLTGEEVIELYYRSRAAGGKVTLQRLADKYGFNVTYLSQVKAAYDKAGKWGAKSKVSPNVKK